MLNFFKKKTCELDDTKKSDDDFDIEKAKEILGADSFEVKYLSNYFKDKNRKPNLKNENIKNIIDFRPIKFTFNNKNLVGIFENQININFSYIDFPYLLVDNIGDFMDILYESDENVQSCVKCLEQAKSDIGYIVHVGASKENNSVLYKVCLYSDYNLMSLKCYLTNEYRLKYTKKENRQEGLIWADVGVSCSLYETAKGSISVCTDNIYGGEIGEIGINDSKNILPYLLDLNRYLITCNVIRKITYDDDYGAIVQVSVYDNPLHVLLKSKIRQNED